MRTNWTRSLFHVFPSPPDASWIRCVYGGAPACMTSILQCTGKHAWLAWDVCLHLFPSPRARSLASLVSPTRSCFAWGSRLLRCVDRRSLLQLFASCLCGRLWSLSTFRFFASTPSPPARFRHTHGRAVYAHPHRPLILSLSVLPCCRSPPSCLSRSTSSHVAARLTCAQLLHFQLCSQFHNHHPNPT